MTRRSNHTNSNSRARDKSNKRVRANNQYLRSTIRSNTTFRSVVSKSRSMSSAPVDVSPSQSCVSTDEVRFDVKKTAAGKQSVEVLQNAPIIERAFCRSSSEIFEELTDFECTLAEICIGWIGFELGWKQYIKDNAKVLLKFAIKNLTH